MGRIQKATAAAIALTITLVGATLAVAPMAFADSPQVATHAYHWARALPRHATDLRSDASPERLG